MASFDAVPDQVVTSHVVDLYARYDGTTHTRTVTIQTLDATGNVMHEKTYPETGQDYMSATDDTNLTTIMTNLHTKGGTEAT